MAKALDRVVNRLEALESKLDRMQECLQTLHAGMGRQREQRASEFVLDRLGSLADVSTAEIQFLRGNEMFAVLTDEALKVVYMLGDRVIYDRGAQVFGVGDICDTLYVVKRGTLEIRRTGEADGCPDATAFLGVGELLCEMGVLPGTRHESMACALDQAEVLCYRREVLTGLLTMFPQLAVHMYCVMAARLEKVLVQAGSDQTRQRKLQGCLEHFDLASILQSLILGEKRRGVLSIRNEHNERVARIQLGGGTIGYAEMGALRGRDAIYEMFHEDFGGHSFAFRECTARDEIEMPADPELAHVSGTSLLLDVARMTDEVGRIKQDVFADPQQVYRRAAGELGWADEATRDVAERIWNRSAEGTNLSELLALAEISQAQTYCVLGEMVRLGLLRPDSGLPVEEEAESAPAGSWLAS